MDAEIGVPVIVDGRGGKLKAMMARAEQRGATIARMKADVAAGKWSYRKPRLRAEFPVGVMGLGVLAASRRRR